MLANGGVVKASELPITQVLKKNRVGESKDSVSEDSSKRNRMS